MANATSGRQILIAEEAKMWPFPVAASTHVYFGTLLSKNSSGYVTNSSDTASEVCVGVCNLEKDNSSGSNGDKTTRVAYDFVTWFTCTGVAVTDIGSKAYASDNQTVATSTSNSIEVGRIMGVKTTNQAWVHVKGLTL